MNTKLSKVMVWFMLVSLLISSCASQKVKITSVERTKSFGYSGATASARPGYDILLIGVETSEEISPFGGDLALKDDAGNSYPMMGLFNSKYIFEVPETVKNLTLIVKGSISVPVR